MDSLRLPYCTRRQFPTQEFPDTELLARAGVTPSNQAREDVPIVACDRNTPGIKQRGFRAMGRTCYRGTVGCRVP
jgi:hypothetical protein